MTAPAPTEVGATAVADRSLAPDVARGAMLLLIALANSHLYLHGHGVGIRGYPGELGGADQVVTLLQMSLVDGRAYPMFAALFGYGIVQLTRRLTTTGRDPVTIRKLVRRRGWWMLLFGFGHALLLFSGDIIGAYGLLAVIFAGLLLRARDRTLLVVAGCWMILAALGGLFQGLPPMDPDAVALLPSMGTSEPLVAALTRVVEWLVLIVVLGFFSLVPALLFGVWAGRRRILDEPERFVRPLRIAAVAGIAVAVLGGLPSALMAAGLWADPAAAAAGGAGALHAVTGYLGGVGYAALAGLLALRARERRGPVVTALSACGQRSMTCYLLQSVVFVAVLASYGGGLGDRFTVATTALLAVGTWAAIVLLAELMRRGGYRGPFEVALRRLTYRRRA